MHTASAQQTKNPLRPFDNSLLTSLPLLEVRADAPTFFVFWSIVPQGIGFVNKNFSIFLVILTHIFPCRSHNRTMPHRATTIRRVPHGQLQQQEQQESEFQQEPEFQPEQQQEFQQERQPEQQREQLPLTQVWKRCRRAPLRHLFYSSASFSKIRSTATIQPRLS